ncbi:MAG: hypothetical protein NTV81_00710 [Candidatus Komeilibacteria bacterium]|nr:hypothetical protein [Candidatus Komeilibacteria bacterium]
MVIETGYYLKDNYIYGPGAESGEFYLGADQYIYGPINSGLYYLKDGKIYGNGQNGQFYFENNYLHGPETTPPWEK